MAIKVPQHPVFGWVGLALLAFLSGDLAAAALERQFQGVPKRTVAATVNTTVTGPVALNGIQQVGELKAVLSRSSGTVVASVNGTATNITTGSPTVGGPVVATNGNVTGGNATGPLPVLAGTMEGQGASLAVLQSGGQTQVVAVGEEWLGYRVIEVGTYQARVRDSRGAETLISMALAGLPSPTPPAMVAAANTTAANETAANVTTTAPITTSRELKELLNNRQEFIRDIHVQPVMKGDQTNGIQLTFTTATNPFARLGFQSGDTILSFNSKPLTGMSDMSWALSELRNATTLNFQVERGGQPQPLVVNLQP